MKRTENIKFCKKVEVIGLTFEKQIFFDFHQFICLASEGYKLLKINSFFSRCSEPKKMIEEIYIL